MRKIYVLKGLDCPNCSSKIEKEIGDIRGVRTSTINLLKQTLLIDIDDNINTTIEDEIKKIVHIHEPDVEVFELKDAKNEKITEIGKSNIKIFILRLILGAFFFLSGIVIGEILKYSRFAEISLLIISYVILGYDVLYNAFKSITQKYFLDENFLMSISSIGAFFIGECPEAVAVMLFYQIGEFFQEMSINNSRRSISDLIDIRPDCASVIRNGTSLTVSPDEVFIGESIIIKPGERIPLDGTIISGNTTIDTTALTGESVPKMAQEGDNVLSGCINLTGVITIKVTKSYSESTASKIIELVENASSKKAKTEKFITTFARYYTPIVVISAVLLALIPPMFFKCDWLDWIRRGMVFLVISCPCALVISIPLAFFGGIGAASKHGILIKGGNYLEALNNVNTVVFDKTGTLTKGSFIVTNIISANGFTKESVIEYAAKAESFSTHPIALSVITAYGKPILKNEISEYNEKSGYGVTAVINGIKIIAGNSKMMEKENISFHPCDDTGTKVYVAINGTYAGCIMINDEIKPDSKYTIEKLKSLGIEKTIMLTGDNKKIAANVSKQLRIDEYYAELLPNEKVDILEYIETEKQQEAKIIFVGDGINDAPVLARSDIGVAMGGLGSDASIEAADIVLMTDEPSKLIKAIEIAMTTRRIVTQNIIIALGVKIILMILGALGITGMWEAVFGDVGVAMIAVFNAIRIMKN